MLEGDGSTAPGIRRAARSANSVLRLR